MDAEKNAVEADRQFLFTANRKQARRLQIEEAAEAGSSSPLRVEDEIQRRITGTECRLAHYYKGCKTVAALGFVSPLCNLLRPCSWLRFGRVIFNGVQGFSLPE